MAVQLRFTVQGGDFTNAGFASSQVKKILKQLNIDNKIIKRVAISLYEAEVNIVAHAWNGTVTVDIDEDRIRLFLSDRGPGIADIELAMKEGYSTASPVVREMGFGAGMGLSNMKKNSDQLTITSEVNQGTEVEIIHYLHAQ
ncbi:MAG: ATP-binding protein [Bacteroidales bacterium]|jgi:anti-sigma regulatory factor (Ser/Thr protein kinase)